MFHRTWTTKSVIESSAKLIALLALVILFVSCKNAADSKPAQRTFATPAEAGTAFLDAAKSGDQQALLAIFGPDGKDVLFSGDPVKDKNGLQDFVAAYGQMNRWREIKAGGEILYVGADNYPFPVPLVKNPSGQWSFDTAAGKDEILARRIGKGELTAIAACLATANAQQQYFSSPHDGDSVKQYAQRIRERLGQGKRAVLECSQGARMRALLAISVISRRPSDTPVLAKTAAVQWLLLQDPDQTRR